MAVRIESWKTPYAPQTDETTKRTDRVAGYFEKYGRPEKDRRSERSNCLAY